MDLKKFLLKDFKFDNGNEPVSVLHTAMMKSICVTFFLAATVFPKCLRREIARMISIDFCPFNEALTFVPIKKLKDTIYELPEFPDSVDKFPVFLSGGQIRYTSQPRFSSPQKHIIIDIATRKIHTARAFSVGQKVNAASIHGNFSPRFLAKYLSLFLAAHCPRLTLTEIKKSVQIPKYSRSQQKLFAQIDPSVVPQLHSLNNCLKFEIKHIRDSIAELQRSYALAVNIFNQPGNKKK